MVSTFIYEHFKEDLEQAQINSNVPGFQAKSKSILDSILKKEESLHNIILFSLIWSMGGTLDEGDKIKFEEFIRALVLDGKIDKNLNYQFGPYNHISIFTKKFKDFSNVLKVTPSCFDIQLHMGKLYDWDNLLIQ